MSEEPVSVIKSLPVKLLSLHPTIQHFRHMDKPKARDRFVQGMNDNFNPLAIGTPVAVPRNDSEGWFIVIGGHRLELCRVRGIKTLRCEVIEGLNGNQEAELIQLVIDESTVRAWTPLNRFDLNLRRKWAAEVEIEATLNKYGSTVGQSGWRSVKSLYTIRDLGVLDETIRIITTAWDVNLPDTRNASILKAVAGFHAFYSKRSPERYEAARLIQVLKGKLGQPRALLSFGRQAGWDNNLSTVIAERFVTLYNSGLTKGRRLPIYEGRGAY